MDRTVPNPGLHGNKFPLLDTDLDMSGLDSVSFPIEEEVQGFC
jgi:hypothetical protein